MPTSPATAPTGPRRLAEVPAADGPPTGDLSLRPVLDHRDFVLSQVPSLRPFGIGLLDAYGLTLCESLQADINIPVVSTATVAGWAVRGSNLVGASIQRPVQLPVVGEIAANGFGGAPLQAGTTVKVAAGAPVPEGSDAVVALADGRQYGDQVQFTAETSFHQNLLLAGSRIADGSPLLDSGTVLTTRTLGLLAEVGIDKVLARPKPRVVVASVGADLVEPGQPLERIGQAYDRATALIAAAARSDGAQVYPVGVMPSDPAELRLRLSDQLVRADLILVAAGHCPEFRSVLGELGAVTEVEPAIEPSGRAIFAVIGDEQVPVIVLPREAVAAYVHYQVFGRPVVRKLAGVEPLERDETTHPTLQPITVDPARTTFVLAQTFEHGVVPIPIEGPGALELVEADTLIVIQPGTRTVEARSPVVCWPLDD